MRAFEIGSAQALHALRPEWDALVARSGTDLPFHTWEWVTSWWKHWAADKLSVRDTLYAHGVRDDAGKLVAIAPMMITSRPGRGPLAARYAQFFGADPNVTELRGVLCEPGLEPQVYAALLQALRATADRWDWLDWTGIPVASGAAVPGVAHEQQPGFVLPLPASWEELKRGLKRNIKESLRKCYNAPARDGLVLAPKVARTPDEIRAALPKLIEMHGARASVEDGVIHKNVFADPRTVPFITDVTLALAAKDAVRIYQVEVNGAVAAARMGFVLNGKLYLYYSGYDPALGKYSVMTTAVAEALQAAIDERLESANFSFGEDVSKTRWGPEAVAWQRVSMTSGLRGRLAKLAYEQARAGLTHPTVHRLARRVLGRT